MRQRPGANANVIPYHTADVYRAIDSGFHMIPDYGAKLPPFSINARYNYTAFVQPEIGNLGTGTQVTAFADSAIAHIANMRHLTALHDNRVLYLNG